MIPVTLPPSRPGMVEFIQSEGQSEEARHVQAMVAEFRGHQRVRAAFADLEAARSEAAVDGWNGHGGKAVSPRSYRQARRLLGALLMIGPEPEITIDAEGDFELDWIIGTGRALTLSISGDGRIAFAWIDGTRRGHGTEWFTGGIPAAIATAIGDVTRGGDSR